GRRAVDVGADIVAFHQVAGGAVVELHAVFAVAGDDVAEITGGAADGVARRGVARRTLEVDLYAVGLIRQRGVAGDVGAEEVAGHQVAGGPRTKELHAVAFVPGDDVAGAGGAAADGVGVRAADDQHAIADVPEAGSAGDVRADPVACDQVAGRALVVDLHAV